MKSSNYLFLFFALLLSGCSAFQYADAPSRTARSNQGPPHKGEPGKCYAKCLMPDQFDQTALTYAVFTGDENEEEVELEEIVLELTPASTEWVKKKADRNCLSANPDDCLVWCLVEKPAEIAAFKVLTDTSQSDSYVMRTFYKGALIEKGGFTEWKEILCPKDVTPEFISQLNVALISNGYEPDIQSNTLSPKTKGALSLFQKSNNLPVGNLDVETLTALGL